MSNPDQKVMALKCALDKCLDIIGYDKTKTKQSEIIYSDNYDAEKAKEVGYRAQVVISIDGISIWNLMGAHHSNKPIRKKFATLEQYLIHITDTLINDKAPARKPNVGNFFWKVRSQDYMKKQKIMR